MPRLLPFRLRGKTLFLLIGLAIVAPILLLVLASVFRIDLRIDAAALVSAAALALVAFALVLVVRYLTQPKETVSVGYSVKLEQPVVPMVGRYSFRLEVFYEVELKGERARVDQGTIQLRFRGKDHPELLEWCCERISEHLGKHATFAQARYPGARILLPPEPTRSELAAEVRDLSKLGGKRRRGPSFDARSSDPNSFDANSSEPNSGGASSIAHSDSKDAGDSGTTRSRAVPPG